jgi:cytochrome c peroxidase
VRNPFWIGLVAAISAVALSFGVPGPPSQAASKTPPIPEAGLLAQPKSLDQVGLPAELTRQAIPPDNPQTPEKIALGEKLFFDGRLSADGAIAY